MSRRPSAKNDDEAEIETACVNTLSTISSGVITKLSYQVGLYKIYDGVKTPEYKTGGAACFDIEAYLGDGVDSVTGFSADNTKFQRNVTMFNGNRCVVIEPQERVMIPTGLVFDIPDEFKLSLYPRSGAALKQGLNLMNCVGVIDHDYVDQTFLIIYNNAKARQTIVHGERYAQGEIVPIIQASFVSLNEQPSQKTNRIGGFGSTN